MVRRIVLPGISAISSGISFVCRERPHQFLLMVFGVLSVASLVPHALRPIETSTPYSILTVILLAINTLTLIFAGRRPRTALQIYLWSFMFVILSMMIVDSINSTNSQRARFGLPAVVLLPTVATFAIMWLVSVRAAIIYWFGVAGLLIPAGLVYNDLGRAGALAGAVILSVVADGLRQWNRDDRLRKVRDAASMSHAFIRMALDEFDSAEYRE